MAYNWLAELHAINQLPWGDENEAAYTRYKLDRLIEYLIDREIAEAARA